MRRETKSLVAGVAKFKDESPQQFDELINTIGDCAATLIEIVRESPLDRYSLWDFISTS